MSKIALAIPTYNAGKDFEKVVSLINKQSELINYKMIIDSSSIDNTVSIAKEKGFDVSIIDKNKFSHGGTRTLVADKLYKEKYDFLIFMSQDVFLQDNAIEELVKYIVSRDDIGVVRGKQEVDLSKGNIFEYFARQKNYSDKDLLFTKKDIAKFGIDTIYTSDAFAIYNLKALQNVGFFGQTADVSEDMLAAHNLIQKGYKVGYASKAKVFHTHNYTIIEEFYRYILIGKFYYENDSWISEYGNTGRKGIDLAKNEIVFLTKRKKIILIPKSIIRNLSKFIGFQIGKLVK